MATRTIPFSVYNTDGTRYTEETPPTATVQYGSAAASSVTATKRGNAWSVDVDDTQDALIMWSGTGIQADHIIALRFPTQLDVAVSTRLASASYTTPPLDYATAAQVDALNDLSMLDVAQVLGEYDVATVGDVPTDYATEETAANVLKFHTNRRVVTDSEQVIYDDDDVTPLVTQALTATDTSVERSKGV